jgi:hypothetical protein
MHDLVSEPAAPIAGVGVPAADVVESIGGIGWLRLSLISSSTVRTCGTADAIAVAAGLLNRRR